MNFFKRQWNNFVHYVLDNKKTIIINYIFFIISMVILLLIDLLTKHFLFDSKKADSGEVQHLNALFGIRSVTNKGLTFASSLYANIGLITFFNIIIMIACIGFIIFLKNYWFAIFIGFIFAGSLGNSVDRLAFGYVRDIIFLPWCDRGTFNFADVDVILGSFGIMITLITIYLKDYLRNRK